MLVGVMVSIVYVSIYQQYEETCNSCYLLVSIAL